MNLISAVNRRRLWGLDLLDIVFLLVTIGLAGCLLTALVGCEARPAPPAPRGWVVTTQTTSYGTREAPRNVEGGWLCFTDLQGQRVQYRGPVEIVEIP